MAGLCNHHQAAHERPCRHCGGETHQAIKSTSIVQPCLYQLHTIITVPSLSDALQSLPNGVQWRSDYVYAPTCDAGLRYHVNLYPHGSMPRYENNAAIFVHLTADPRLRISSFDLPFMSPEVSTRKLTNASCEEGSQTAAQLATALDQMTPLRVKAPGLSERHGGKSTRQMSMRFALLDAAGRVLFERMATHDLAYDWRETEDEKQQQNNWGYRRFCTTDELLQYVDASDGALRLSVELFVAAQMRLCVQPITQDWTECMLNERAISQIRQESDGDLILICGATSVQVHSLLFAAISKPYCHMLAWNIDNARNSFDLSQELTPQALLLLRDYLYAVDTNSQDLSAYLDLLAFGDKHLSDELVSHCEQRLKQLARTNPIELFKLTSDLARKPYRQIEQLHQCAVAQATRCWTSVKHSAAVKDIQHADVELYATLVEAVCLGKLAVPPALETADEAPDEAMDAN